MMVGCACGPDTLISPHLEAHTLLRAGRALRFTPDEVDEFRSLGVDFEGRERRTTSSGSWPHGPMRSPMNVLIC